MGFTAEYLTAFREKAKDLLPGWMVDRIHKESLPVSGGRGRQRAVDNGEIALADPDELLDELATFLGSLGYGTPPAPDFVSLDPATGQPLTVDNMTESAETPIPDPDPDQETDLPADEDLGPDRLEPEDAAEIALRALWRHYMATHAPPSGYDAGSSPNMSDFSASEKAEWSTAQINDFPDSSFAYVEPGKKDAEGKTTPRELRHYPYKGADGAVDLPHLRNALARAAQGVNAGGKAADIANKALPKLQAAAKIAGVGEANKTVTIWKADGSPQQIVYGVVLVPEQVDSQGDIVSADEIEAAAHKFLTHYRESGIQHVGDALPSLEVIESYIAPIDMEVAGNQVPKGAWILAIKINDPEIWAMVLAGTLTGFSIQGWANTTEET